jgi:CHAT domain
MCESKEKSYSILDGGTVKLLFRFLIIPLVWSYSPGIGFARQSPVAKVQTGNIIRHEYYTACDFFADGQTSQAAVLFDTALAQSRSINNQRGIDSIPPMVKLGECFWEQCDIGMALERYDAALQVTLLHTQRWVTLLNKSGSIRPETRIREVPWAGTLRPTQMGSYSEVTPIPLGSAEILLESTAGQGVTGKLVAIDALEILRCQAIALRRRYQLLGPLAKYNPLTDPLLKAFSLDTKAQSEPIQVAMNICRALANIGAGERVQSEKLLIQSLSLTNGLDHPLTAVALLALADLAIDANATKVAEERAMEASVVAGRAGQMEHLAEAVEYLSKTGFADGHDVVAAKTLQAIFQWSGTKSRLVSIRTQVEMARLSALVGAIDLATKQCHVATSMLLPKQVVMPRAESVVRYAEARIALLEARLVDGIGKLFESTAYLRGNEKGIGSPPLFQLDLALQLTKGKAINETVADDVLGQLLSPRPAGHWRVHPLEQLDWLMINKSEAKSLLLDLQLRTKDDGQLAATFDDAKVQRYRRNNELEARVFDLKLLLHGDNRFGVNSTELTALKKLLPLADQNATKMQQLIAPLQASPKLDLRKWTEDETKRWESVLRLATAQETLLWSASISPIVIPEAFPPRHSQELLAKSLRPTDAVVMFAAHGSSIKGFLYTAGRWRSWDVTDGASVERKITNLLSEMQLLKKKDADAIDVKKNWGLERQADLRNQLFPQDIWANMISAERWIVIPDASLWYLPIESLPISDSPFALPCLSEHSITYSPTLGLVPYLFEAKPQSKSVHGIDVHVQDFLCHDANKFRSLSEDLAARKRHIVDLNIKPSFFPTSRWFKVTADSINTYAPMGLDEIAPVATDPEVSQSSIRTWSSFPWGTPSSMLLAGVDAVPPAAQSTGDDWLRIVLPLIAQGTRQLTVSRWSVGGESTVSLMKSFCENQEDLAVSEAWQRSVLMFWEDQFEQRNEPLFKMAPFAKPENRVFGSHPLLWSGYLRIGDSK